MNIVIPMNRLPAARRAQIIQMLSEGSSLRATSRLAGVSINTVTKILADIGEAANEYHDHAVRNVQCRLIQCNEIWCLVLSKRRT